MNPAAAFGTREDPHAQARWARQQPLLLHSLSCFREIFELIYAHRVISTVVEVGAESGQMSTLYAELGATSVYCVDPAPNQTLRTAVAGNDALHLVERPSPDVLPELPPADLYVLDGDHNYATVRPELTWVLEHAPDAVIVLHDLLWPWSRRDLYYEPSRLTSEDRHPSSPDGPTIWHDELTPAGFVGLGAFTCSEEAGGERNGVLTAVEDALAAAGADWWLVLVPAIFGLGVVVRDEGGSHPLLEALRPYTDSRLLAMLENNRLALYTRVLQLQYEAVAHAADADALANTIAAQRHELDRLTEQAGLAQRQQAEIVRLNKENEQLKKAIAERPAGAIDLLKSLSARRRR
ncbi:class I SAM-dependent methyltransferase [Amycolatopsis taiwanensis]|uniref:class I SAM-dependent methyltransferase n=1 Tax=Amycolatopsis taiwanensis TaxID=342230 RepID=UPI0004B39D4E|nr:class I SAM-dependent methyltransferase [Amycolatopsis taiwanensis]